MLCHLAGLLGFFLPPANILGPLVMWLIRRRSSPFIDAHGKEAVNYQISITAYSLIPGIGLAVFPVVFIPIALALIGFVLWCIVRATIYANRGRSYRYPFALRLIK